ncbi:MAG: ribosome recycling factor [Cocleimonas sp.]|nr:ribosome recycling factor [Cocleimonas sp.]
MIDEIIEDAESRMKKSIESLKGDLTKIRTGRAHPSILDHITVDYYGGQVPLNQVGNVSIEDARTLSISVWESPLVPVIEKAIMTSDLGLNPMSAGTVIRVPMPPLTEERRRDLVKVVKGEGEGAKIAIRNIRRDANADFKSLQKDKDISEDDERRAQGEIQKLTDQYVKQVDVHIDKKESELMEV